MGKLIYVCGEDDRLLQTLVSSLRAAGYAAEYAEVSDDAEAASKADITLSWRDGKAALEKLSFGGVTVYPDERRVIDETGEELHLTPTEYSLLCYLLRYATRAVSREELLRAVWNYSEPSATRVADDTVKRLRKKISATRLSIETVWGYGFKLNER